MCSQYRNNAFKSMASRLLKYTCLYTVILVSLGRYFYEEMYLLNMNHSIKACLLFSNGYRVAISNKMAKHKRANLFPSAFHMLQMCVQHQFDLNF